MGAGEAGGVDDVVEMGVGEEEGVELEAEAVHPGGGAFGGVDGDVPVGAAEEVAVGGGEAAGVDEEGIDMHLRSHGESDGLFKAIRDVLAKNPPSWRLAEKPFSTRSAFRLFRPLLPP